MTKSSFEKKIGIIGLGVLGSAIAKNFIDKNISISGYDINEKVFEGLKSNKIKAYDAIDKISDKCKFLITCLPSEASLINVAKSLSKNDKLIIIETSGSCHPMPLTQYFKNHSKLILTKILVLLDSLMLAQDFNYGKNVIPQMQNNLAQNKRDTVNLMVEQIMFGSHLILTKGDRIEKKKQSSVSDHQAAIGLHKNSGA